MLFQGTRYTKTPAYLLNGVLVVEKRTPATFDMTNATYYTFIESDTLDGLAYRIYGDAKMWWAILDANPQFLTEIEIRPGDVLAIPPLEEVQKWV